MDAAVSRAIAVSPLFSGMKIDESTVRVETLRKGRLLDDVVGRCSCIGLIVEGTVDVYSIAEDGSEILLSELRQGDVFGICNLFTHEALPTVLRCRSECRILFMPKRRFAVMLGEDGALALRYARICNNKIAFLLRRIEELTLTTSTTKLEAYLRDHADENGVVAMPATRDDLARHLGISRSALFREIARLKKKGVVFSHGRTLRIRANTQARHSKKGPDSL